MDKLKKEFKTVAITMETFKKYRNVGLLDMRGEGVLMRDESRRQFKYYIEDPTIHKSGAKKLKER